MKLSSFVLILVVAACVATLPASASENGTTTEALGARQSRFFKVLSNLKLPKMFHFDKFKRIFGKKYPSHAEESARSKIYFGRAFKVFISGVQFVWKKSSKYLKISAKSDWTLKERQAAYTYPTDQFRRQLLQMDEVLSATSDGDATEEDPAVELEEVEEILGEILSKQGENPDYAKVAAELMGGGGGSARRKRHVMPDGGESRRQVDLYELVMGEPQVGKSEPTLEKLANSIESNNPDYESLEVFSQGADDGDSDSDKQQQNEMPEDEVKKTLAQKGKKYLQKVVKKMLHPLANNRVADFILAKNRHEPDLSLPDEVFLDYRDTGCFYHVKDQNQCGSCYIFSTTALFEYHHCRQSGTLIPFSEQYIVDCGKRIEMKGCRGGLESQVGSFVDEHGLELQHDYPYSAQAGQCPYSAETPSRLMGHTRAGEAQIKYLDIMDSFDKKKVEKALKKHGPMTIAVNVNDDFPEYGGGVDMLNGCSWSSGHSMLLVGHGRQDGLEYWLIRNSHGVSFGESGYYKLSKKFPLRCMIQVGYVNPKFDRNGSHRERIYQRHKQLHKFKQNFGV